MPREGQKRLGKEQEVEPGSAGPEPRQAHLAEVGGYPVRQEPGKTAHSLQGGRGLLRIRGRWAECLPSSAQTPPEQTSLVYQAHSGPSPLLGPPISHKAGGYGARPTLLIMPLPFP